MSDNSQARFGRLSVAEQRSGLKRGKLYELAEKHRGLFKKAGTATIVDLELLDIVLSKLPAADVGSTKKTAA